MAHNKSFIKRQGNQNQIKMWAQWGVKVRWGRDGTAGRVIQEDFGYGHHSVILRNIHREPVTLLDAKGTHTAD